MTARHRTTRSLVLVLALAAPLLANAAPQARPDAPVTAGVPANAEDARLQAIYTREWAWRHGQLLVNDEELRGDEPVSRLRDVSAEAQATRLAYWREVLRELDGIDVERLSAAERLNYQVYRPQIEHLARAVEFGDHQMPFNADSSFWSSLGFMARERPADARAFRAYIARLRDVPRYFDQHIDNMRAGLARGFSVPRATLDGRDASIAQIADLTRAEDSPFYEPFQRMPAAIPAAEQAALRAEAVAAIDEALLPAYRTLLAFFRDEYLPQARTTLAAHDLPDGKAWYAEQIAYYTTLPLSADRIHQIGLEEVAKIRAEMDAIIDATGFTGNSPQTRFQDFLAFLRTDPQFYADTPQELLNHAAWIAKRIDARIGDVIGTLPRGRFTIIEVPPTIAPFWTAGRGGRGTYWLNTYDLPSRPLYNLPALTLHEAEPGHALQGALALEAPEVPGFRRQYISAYGEGWGLYSEWLGKEMGIYETPYEDFGRLTYAMWRAARLVIDTGVHAKGWSRDQALAYLRDNTALSEHEVTTEVDRYISWPGQALSYKLGELAIVRLRGEGEAALGEDFDVKAFHDKVLSLGSVPLPVLETQLREWFGTAAN
ncbi:MAG: DUF885 family protein [Pseudoxanthomonas suwonensis]|nr:DUF885 family protein [Pseudoxanthomonas suwonensis]